MSNLRKHILEEALETYVARLGLYHLSEAEDELLSLKASECKKWLSELAKLGEAQGEAHD